MEDNRLQPDTRFFSFEGYIGRRDYFLNLVYIWAISTIVTIPYMSYIYTHISTLADCFRLSDFFLTSPIILQMWMALGTVGVCTLSVSNIFRRLNDINGKENQVINIICAAIAILNGCFFLMPLFINFFASIAATIMGLILLFKRGKISSTLPYDFTKEFNWGAFLGTWLWGLFNKSFIPLWQLLIQFTPLSLHFKLFCGLKGNEWAYKNKNWNDVKAFNKSQETQTIVFLILYLLVVPILWILLIVGIVALISSITNSAGLDNTKINSENLNSDSGVEQIIDKSEKTTNFMDKFINILNTSYFDSHEITEDENKFYISSQDWQSYSFREKKNIIDMAANIAATERQKAYKKTNQNEYKSFTKSEELNRTKIYATGTDELLGEFYMELTDKISPKEIFKSVLTSYKFYNPEK